MVSADRWAARHTPMEVKLKWQETEGAGEWKRRKQSRCEWVGLPGIVMLQTQRLETLIKARCALPPFLLTPLFFYCAPVTMGAVETFLHHLFTKNKILQRDNCFTTRRTLLASGRSLCHYYHTAVSRAWDAGAETQHWDGMKPHGAVVSRISVSQQIC